MSETHHADSASSDEESFELIDDILSPDVLPLAASQKPRISDENEAPKKTADLEITAEILIKHEEPEKAPLRTVTMSIGANGKIGLRNCGNCVLSVLAGQPAELSGVREGDQIVSMDGVNVEMASREEIGQLFQRAGSTGSITLVLRFNPERVRDIKDVERHNAKMPVTDVTTNDGRRTVILNVGENGFFGMGCLGNSVSTVNVEQPAHAVGIQPGDQIISIDGVNVERTSREEIQQLFKRARASGSTALVVRSNPERLRDIEQHWQRPDDAYANNLNTATPEKVPLVDATTSEKIPAINSTTPEELRSVNATTPKEIPLVNTTTQDGILLTEPDTRTVTLSLGADGTFGARVYVQSGCIEGVTDDGPAHRQGIQRGDQILAIDGVVIESLSETGVLSLTEKARAAGTMTVKLRHNPELLEKLEMAINLKLEPTFIFFLFFILAFLTMDTFLFSLSPRFWMYVSLLVLNFVFFYFFTEYLERQEVIITSLHSHSTPIPKHDNITDSAIPSDTENTPPAENAPMEVTFRTVKLCKGADGFFGFHTIGASIFKVEEGGPAELARIQVGDKIVSIDGRSTANLSGNSVWQILKNAKGATELVVKYCPEVLEEKLKVE